MPEPRDIGFADEIAAYRPVLYKLALLQLRDQASAEDATQDAILAAIESKDSFKGRAKLRTWLISILKHKILDSLRAKKRQSPKTDPNALQRELDLAAFDPLFEDNGCWATPKDAWSDPHANVERIEFFRTLDACLTKLPTNTSRVFLMRSWLELNSDEVCKEVGVSAGNLRVLLYRARMQLRECLDRTWERPE
ncbi:MAG: sigma-70 family RNA polymerase sigma factor [Hyphomicrobiaceae bacterium]